MIPSSELEPAPATARSPFSARDAPATRADLFEGMELLPGEGVPGYQTPPLRPSFAPALVPDWHAVHSPDYPAIKWVGPADGDAGGAGGTKMREHAVSWKTLARWQRIAAAYIARAMGIAPGEEDKYWRRDNESLLVPGLRGELMAEVIAFVAASCDPLTYRLLSAGCERLGLIPLLISANNSAAAIAHTIAACNAQAVLGGPKGASPPLDAKLEQALELVRNGKTEVNRAGAQLRTIPWPASFDALFPLDETESHEEYDPLPLASPWAAFDAERPVAILHSSGTTALFPKPIILRQRLIMANSLASFYGFRADIAPEPPAGAAAIGGAQHKRMRGGIREATMLAGHLPPAHGMGFYVERYSAFSSSSVGYLARPGVAPKPVTPAGILEAALNFENVSMTLPPAILEGIAKDEKLLSMLKAWPSVTYSGGPLPRATFEKLRAAGVRPATILGSTEACPSTRWNYDGTANDDPFPADICGGMEASRALFCHFRPLSSEERSGAPGGEDEYELVYTARGPFAKPAVLNAEWEGEPAYATGDRVRLLPPGKSGQPRFVLIGRLDPGIVLSTGEKTNPQPMVAEVEKSDAVAEALMFGQGRQFNGILVRPSDDYGPVDTGDDEQVARFRNEIWAAVEKANAIAPSHSAIYKEMILIASADKPFEYTAKGTLRHAATLASYSREIERIYSLFERASDSGIRPPASWADARGVHEFTRAVVAEALRMDPREVRPADDMFRMLGADSLTATKIRNALLAALAKGTGKGKGKAGEVRLPGNFVYNHPSVDALAQALVQVAANGSAHDAAASSEEERMRVLQALIDNYTGNWPERSSVPNDGAQRSKTHDSARGHVFVVTGTTGGAGAHFLAQLAARPDVARVYALNRAARDGAPLLARQQDALRARGEPEGVAVDAKVTLLEADTADGERLGLAKERYEEIRDCVTHIIHNAWRLDFNLGVSSFEDQIASVRSLALLALRSPRALAPRLLFMSSVAVATDWCEARPVPEAASDARTAGAGGYAQAKAAAEAVLLDARRARALDAAAVRLGQLSGSGTNAAWAQTDWVPLLVRSALALRCLPTAEGDIHWLPADTATRVVLEFALADGQLPPVLHVTNPRGAPWSAVIGAVADFLQPLAGADIRLVSPTEWAAALAAAAQEAAAGTSDELLAATARNPALKLLPFFESLAARAASNAAAAAADAVPREALGPTRLDTREAQRRSATLRGARPVCAEDVTAWLRAWQRAGFLPAEP